MHTATFRERVKYPFVFLTYATENYGTANDLYNKLLSKGVNVIFDEGGLEGGASLREFEQLILHDNCYKVLIIFDSNYKRRIDEKTGEVWEEFCLIRDSFCDDMASKFVPVLCPDVKKCDLPAILKHRDVYVRITETKKIISECIEKRVDAHINLIEAEKMINLAESLYDKTDYKPCEETLRKIISSGIKGKKANSLMAKIYSMILCLYIKGFIVYSDEAREALEKLSVMVGKRPVSSDKDNLPLYMLNCSLSYSKRGEHGAAIEKATGALSKAREYGFSNIYYYECALSEVFAASGANSHAKEHIEKAYSIICEEYGGFVREDILTTWDIYINYANIMINLADEESNKRQSRKYLDDAFKSIEYLNSHFSDDDFDQIYLDKFYEVNSKYYDARRKLIA